MSDAAKPPPATPPPAMSRPSSSAPSPLALPPATTRSTANRSSRVMRRRSLVRHWWANRRTALFIGTAGVVALAVAIGTTVALAREGKPARPIWHEAVGPTPSTAQPSAPGQGQIPAAAQETITLSATGDIVMAAMPRLVPPNNGVGFFDNVTAALAADVVMGNLEEPLTDDTGYVKCAANSTACHQFRAPPEYAAYLRNAGFTLLNLANNHAYDFGAAGHRNTQRALEQYGLAHTGDPGQITTLTVRGIRVAVLGFSSYSWSNSLLDLTKARSLVQRAAADADLVVVQVHMGAEGSDSTRVRPGTEMFLGENRGDPIRFAHAVIDAGADLVVGHGPHVMRALEFYQGRLIAYSLGNFAGGAGALSSAGILGYGAVLRVTLRRDGSFAGGSLVATTHQSAGGLPRIDPQRRCIPLVRSLSTQDFPRTGARISATGEISPPE